MADAGRVITMDRATAPREVERVRCYRESDGELIWSHDYDVAYGDLDYGNGPRAAPTIDGDFVYTVGALGHVFCLKAETGEVVWSTHLEETLHGRRPTWGYAASPLVERGFVILQPGGLDGYSIVALRKESGELAWHSLADDAGYTWPVVAPRTDHTQLVCWTPSHIRGVDFEDGRPLWEIPYEVTYGVAIATPVYVDGLVFVSGYWEGSKAIRLGPQPTDAQLAWVENDFLRGLMAQPLVRGEHAYLLDKGRGLTCFELATGRKLWDDGNRLTPRGRNPQASLVWIGETDRALALNSDGQLVQTRLTPAGYEELARAQVCGPTWAHPAYVNRSIIARTDEEIVCCDLPLAE